MKKTERPQKHLQYALSPSPRFCCEHYGVNYSFESETNPDTVIENNIKIQKGLYCELGYLGMGNPDPKPGTGVNGYGIAAIAAMFGCKVAYTHDESPYAFPLNLDEKAAWALRPILDGFDRLEPIKSMLEAGDYVYKKYGSASVSFSYQGYLATAVKLRGEAFLSDFYDDPALARHILDVVYDTTEALRAFITDYNANKYGARPSGMTQATNCAIPLVSPETYREFLFDYDLKCAKSTAPGFGIHHCGERMEQYAVHYAELPRGRYYDIGWGSDVKKCVELFYDPSLTQLIRGRLSPSVFMFENAEYIENTVKYFIDSGANACVCVGFDPATPTENIESFVYSVWEYGKIN